MSGREGTAPRRACRRYTEGEQQTALQEARRLGVSEAARKHGIPHSTLSTWLKAQAARSPAASAAQGPAEGREGPQAGQGASAAADPVPAARVSEGVRRRSRAAKSYTPSQRAEILEYASAHGVTATHKQFDVSRFTIYDWRRKVRLAAEGKGDAPTAGPDPADVEAQRDREILGEWHRHPGLGPSQIKNQLRRKGVKVSVHTTRRVMQEAGYRPPKVKRQGHDERFEAVRPNHLWHLDYVHRFINRVGVHTLILLDDHSRYVTGFGTDDAERADLVIRTFEEAVRRHGRPEMVLHDRGSAFWSWRGISRFTSLLTEYGIDQFAVEHKEHNGKLEVFNANVQKELFDVVRFYDVGEMRRRLQSHLHWYNHQRTSHALGGLLVSADRYYGRADEVLARIEAGAGREGLDTLDLRDRCLELFSVTSTRGVPEVWLMGNKILELPT